MVQRAEKVVFGHFLEFCLLNRFDIANCAITKRFSRFVATLSGQEGSFKKSQKAFLNDPLNQKRGI